PAYPPFPTRSFPNSVWERTSAKLLFRARHEVAAVPRNRSFAKLGSQTGVWEPGLPRPADPVMVCTLYGTAILEPIAMLPAGKRGGSRVHPPRRKTGRPGPRARHGPGGGGVAAQHQRAGLRAAAIAQDRGEDAAGLARLRGHHAQHLRPGVY